MKVVIDGEEFELPEKVAQKVQDANAYRLFLGGKSPIETYEWLSRLEKNIDKILDDQNEINGRINSINKKTL